MSRTAKILIACIFTLAVGIALGFIFKSKSIISSDCTEYIQRIDSLQSEIDLISHSKDSIDQRIDTITLTIEKTRIQYEKERNTILNNTTDEDYVFFLKYLGENKSRLDSINNL